MAVTPPPSWAGADGALRACELCDHHARAASGQLLCTCWRVTCGPPVLCSNARARLGGCGSDAKHHSWAVIDLPVLTPPPAHQPHP